MAQTKRTRTASSSKRVSKNAAVEPETPSSEPTETPESTPTPDPVTPEEENDDTPEGDDTPEPDQDESEESDDDSDEEGDDDDEDGQEDPDEDEATAKPEAAPADAPEEPAQANENAPLTAEQDQEGESDAPTPAVVPEAIQKALDAQAAKVKEKDADPNAHNARPKGKVIPKGEPVEFEAHEQGNQIVVDEDVFLEITARGSTRKTYRLMYRKGTVLPPASVKRIAE